MRYTLVVFCIFAACFGTAHADKTKDAIDFVKNHNTQMCIETGSEAPDTPKDPKLVPPYCRCVMDAFWKSVPMAEQNELARKGASPRFDKKMHDRMAAAIPVCVKKFGH